MTNRPLNTRRLAFGSLSIGLVNIIKILVQLVTLPIMARLLGPAEFGLSALALPTVALLLLLADGGLGSSLARETDDKRVVWSSAFWALNLVSVAMVLIAIALSFAVAELSRQPKLPLIVAAVSINFFFVSWAIIPGARLTRDARVEVGALTDLIATITGAAVAVGMAVAGFGAWSLAGQWVVQLALRALILNWVAPLAPRLEWDWKSLRSHVVIGRSIVGIRLVDQMGRYAENALIGRFLGGAAVGSYALATQVPRFVSEAASNPMWLNLFVQTLHHDKEAATQAYYRLSRILTLLLAPTTFLSAPLLPLATQHLLGANWRETGVLIALLLPSYALSCIGGLSGAILYARGRSDVQFWLSLVTTTLRLLSIASLPFFGLVGACACIAVTYVISLAAGVIVPRKLIGSRIAPLAKAIGPVIGCALASGAVVMAVLTIDPHNLIWGVASGAAGAFAFVALMICSDWRQLRNDWTMVRGMAGAKAAAVTP